MKKKLKVEGKEITIAEEGNVEWFNLNELASKFTEDDSFALII